MKEDVHTPISSSDTCYFCERRATKLCDHPRLGEDNLYAVKNGLCDLPMCNRCARNKGKTFDLAGPGIIDTIDHCPFHDGATREEIVKAVEAKETTKDEEISTLKKQLALLVKEIKILRGKNEKL